jgi:calcineurin-like phosphoesterase family protein
LVHGNHDHHIRRNKGDIQDIFTTCSDYIHLDLRIPNGKGTRKYTFVCMHYPICSWDGMNADVMHLHGHVHLPPHLRIAEGRAMDVGCDGNNLYPMNVEEVISLLRNRPIAKLTLPKDHHEKRLI